MRFTKDNFKFGILLLLTVFYLSINTVFAVSFTDISSHWAKDSILEIAEKGIIKGYDDGTFRPENTISRAEFITLAVRLLEANGHTVQTSSVYPNSYWAIEYITKAVIFGLIEYDEYGEINPENFSKPISREEMASISSTLTNYLGGSSSQTINPPVLKDLASVSKQYEEKVKNVVSLGIIKGDNNSNFLPQGFTKRSEASVVLIRIMNLSNTTTTTSSDKLTLGMKFSQYTKTFDDSVSTSNGISYYFYNTNSKEFHIALVKDGVVVAIYNDPNDTKYASQRGNNITTTGSVSSYVKFVHEYNEGTYKVHVYAEGNKASSYLRFLPNFNPNDRLFSNYGADATNRIFFHIQNDYRVQNGLRPLIWDNQLFTLANAYAHRMKEENFFSHTDPSGGTFMSRLKNANINFNYAGENILFGASNVFEALYLYVNSTGHRENILGNFTHVGTAFSNAAPTNGSYNTTVFVER